jgi:hypothetical protein
LVYLIKQAQENLQKHIHETVPEEYQKCMVGMKRNLKQVLEIAETSTDPKVKLQARAIANDYYKYIIDLAINGVIITDAIKYVQGQMEHLNGQDKKTTTEYPTKTRQSSRKKDKGKKTYNRIF